jgi:hypothetical protein
MSRGACAQAVRCGNGSNNIIDYQRKSPFLGHRPARKQQRRNGGAGALPRVAIEICFDAARITPLLAPRMQRASPRRGVADFDDHNEKGRANPAFLLEVNAGGALGSLDVAGLLALRTLRNFEGDLLAFLQRLEPRHVDRGKMREEIFATAIRSNKAETLRVIEPLHGTCCHFCISLR